MAGYTPLYDHMLDGTLFGKWPHTGIWACLLSRVSREGTIDEVPELLAAKIGVDVKTLMSCIHDFMQPDPNSRTPDHEGRRLALIDPARPWGWVVLNHSKYKEFARKRNYDEKRTASGADAERKRIERASRRVPTRPDDSRDVPLSSPSPSPTPSPYKSRSGFEKPPGQKDERPGAIAARRSADAGSLARLGISLPTKTVRP